jgi:hypothetical protein
MLTEANPGPPSKHVTTTFYPYMEANPTPRAVWAWKNMLQPVGSDFHDATGTIWSGFPEEGSPGAALRLLSAY